MVVSQPQPVYLVKGDDATLVSQAVGRLISEVVGGQATDLSVQEMPDDSEVNEILDAALTPAFLTDRRVVVVRNIGRFRAEDAEPLVAYLNNPLSTTSLVLVGGGGAVPQRLSKAIKAKGHVLDVSVPGGKARQGWMKEQFAAAPVKLDRNAVALLTDHIGDEMGSMPGLFDALAAAYGQDAHIDAEQLTPFLGAGGSATPWQLTDSIDAGDTSGAIAALHRMLDAGQRHPLVVLATLVKHVGALLRLDGSSVTSETEAASLLGMAPFPAKKALTQSRRLGSENIARAVELVAQAELDLKGASAWPGEMVLEVLVARLSKLVTPTTQRSSTGARGSRR